MCYTKIKSFFHKIGLFVKESYEIILGVGTFITSIATIYLMCIQNNIQSEANRMHAVENAPHFSIQYEMLDRDSDKLYDTKIINIFNVGNRLSQPANFKIHVYYEVEKIDSIGQKRVFIPINGFYHAQFRTQALDGELLQGYLPNNWLHFFELDREMMFASKGRLFYKITPMDLIQIDYVDIYGNEKTAYYQDEYLISEQVYNDILKTAIDVSYDVEKITKDDIILILEK